MNRSVIFAVLVASVLALGACKKEVVQKTETSPAPATTSSSSGVSVSTIALGKSIGADKRPSATADTFGPKDTIYASVDTNGSGTATLKAKWTYRKDGKETLVKEDTQTINASGPATSEFHVSKPDGWPAGDYRVEIFVADNAAGSKSFTVK